MERDQQSNEGGITCVGARDLISAATDDEATRSELARLGVHLEHCAECAAHADRVAALTRRVRVRGTGVDDALVMRVVNRSRPPRLGRGSWLRPALAWCGVVIAFQSLQPLILGEVDGVSSHVARHIGAGGVALAIGLLFAAWKPQRAFGLLPLVGALTVTTLVATVLDTIVGQRSPMAESVHLAELVGMLLLWLVAGSPGWERALGTLGVRPHMSRRTDGV